MRRSRRKACSAPTPSMAAVRAIDSGLRERTVSLAITWIRRAGNDRHSARPVHRWRDRRRRRDAPDAWASASAGNRCPPVPPAASSTSGAPPCSVMPFARAERSARCWRAVRRADAPASRRAACPCRRRARSSRSRHRRRNGSVMPLAGIRCKFTAMLMADCNPNRTARPATAKRANGSSFADAWRSARSTMKANRATSSRHSTMPNSSAATAKTKSVWLSGRMRLTVPSPGTAPEPAAALEGFQRLVDVEGVAGGRVDEALDASRHVRHREIGAGKPGSGCAGEPEHPDRAACRRERTARPTLRRSAWSGRNRAAAPEPATASASSASAMVFAGISGRRAVSPNSQAIRMTKAGLRNSDGCRLTPRNDDPAARALDLGTEGERRAPPGRRSTANTTSAIRRMYRGRQERSRQQHDQRRNQVKHMAGDEIERLEPEPRAQPAGSPRARARCRRA